MSRGLTATNVTASQGAVIRPIIFVELQFTSGTLYFHNAVGTFTWGLTADSPPVSKVWTGLGEIISIGPIRESDDRTAYRVWLRLNALVPALLTEARDEEIYKREVIIYGGYLDSKGNLEDDPEEYWRGFMDNFDVSLGGAADTLTLNCEHESVRDRQANGALFTDEDQQDRFSGDTGFEFLDQLEEVRPHWGPDGGRVFIGAPPQNVPPPNISYPRT